MATEPKKVTVRMVYVCEDIMKLLSCTKPMAYSVIRRLNKELDAAGMITVRGRVPKAYADKRLNLV